MLLALLLIFKLYSSFATSSLLLSSSSGLDLRFFIFCFNYVFLFRF
ncbi:unnamed protein product [Prunus brigantina]